MKKLCVGRGEMFLKVEWYVSDDGFGMGGIGFCSGCGSYFVDIDYYVGVVRVK